MSRQWPPLVDESLLADTVTHGRLPRITARLAAYATHAEAAGARAVLVTCSSMGPAAEAVHPLAGIPVLRVDDPMAAEAVRTGTGIGVVATLESTLAPTVDLVWRHAAAQGAEAVVTASDVRAPTRHGRQEAEGHDRLMAEAARRLAAEHDVLILAQASMAAALGTPPVGAGGAPVPVLTSPAAVRPN
jgi:Asp/Glu/hydantoin racemase